jgi:type IV pilus assembly protein PilN
MTTRINLLPWREMRRRERDRQILMAGAGLWVLMGLAVLYAWLHMNGLIDHQRARNDFLKTEIAKLDKTIAEINELKKQKAALLARMEVIQSLQRNRAQVVHVMDDLVRKLPKGVYFTALGTKGLGVTLDGMAQSNARVSALMRNLDSSDWFTNTSLDVINVTSQGGPSISKFAVRVNQQTPKAPAEPAAGGAAPRSEKSGGKG